MVHISLPSNASLQYFPGNTAANYQVKVPENFPILNSTKSYECAIAEIILPNKFQNIPKKQRIRITQLDVSKVFASSGGKPRHQLEWYVQPGTYSIPALVNIINTECSSGYPFVFRYDPTKEKTYIISKDKNQFIVRLRFDEYLAHILGFKQDATFKRGKKRAKLQRIESPYQTSVQGGLTTLYIYSDIITGQYVGGIRAPLLRIVNWSHAGKADTASVSFDRLHFCSLLTNSFDTIQMFIMDDQGREVKFDDSGTVIIVLEFREILQGHV